MKKNIRPIGKQAGFTLIEIIAVLVIVGILAAVALPRYMDLTSEAEKKSLNAAFAEMKARLNLAYAKSILANDGVPNPANYNQWNDADILLGTTANVRNAFTGFPGTWVANNATITYTAKDGTAYAFTISITGTDPPEAAVTPAL